MKKIISIIISIYLMIASFSISVFAMNIESKVSDEQTIAQAVISSFGKYTVDNTVELYNTSGDIEAVCFDFVPTGYVIVDVNDYSVPEFSPTAETPFLPLKSSTMHYVYNGPMKYYTLNAEGVLYDLTNDIELSIENLSYSYSKKTISTKEKTKKIKLADNDMSIKSTLIYLTNHTPVNWHTSYYCGLDGCAIELKYLYDYHDTDLLTSSMNGSPELQEYLLDNDYIPNSGTSASDIVYGDSPYTGVNDFFRDRGSSIRASKTRYTSSALVEMQESFEDDYPVLLGTEPADDWDYDNHWVIAYGYYYQDLSGAHIIINDGFGNNGIYVTTEADHYDYAILFN